MALTKISTGGVKDDAASQAKIADEAIDEARLQISNAGSNGEFLQKQSGNTGGLTWAAANQYTHPNHSGEVTSTGDGATVIASNIVDEDNLKISNSPTNGQLLSAQSGNTGGLTWTDPPASAPQIEATADGAITAGDTCIVNTNGTVKKVTATYTEKTPVLGTYTQIIDGYNKEYIKVGYDANRKQALFLYRSQNGNSARMVIGTIAGGLLSLGSEQEVEDTTHNVDEIFGLAWSKTSEVGVALYKQQSKVYAEAFTNNGSTLSFGSKLEICDGSGGVAVSWDSAADKFLVVVGQSSEGGSGDTPDAYVLSHSGTTLSSGTRVEIESPANMYRYGGLAYDEDNNKHIWTYCDNGDSGKLAARILTVSGTSVTAGSEVVETSVVDIDTAFPVYITGGKFVVAYIDGGEVYAKVITVSGTTPTFGTQSSKIADSIADNKGHQLSITYDLTGKVVVGYLPSNWTSEFRQLTIDTSANTITAISGATTIGSAKVIDAAYSPDNQMNIFGVQKSDSHGYYRTAVTSDVSTNATTENYIGIAAGTVSSGATATIDVSGATNSSQSSLTPGQKYYVQKDGSLGLTAATPAVFAGTAIAATKLIVNDQQPMDSSPVGWEVLNTFDGTLDFSGGNSQYQTAIEDLGTTYAAYDFIKIIFHGRSASGSEPDNFRLQVQTGGSTWRTNSYTNAIISISGSTVQGTKGTNDTGIRLDRYGAEKNFSGEVMVADIQSSDHSKNFEFNSSSYMDNLSDDFVYRGSSGYNGTTDPLTAIRFFAWASNGTFPLKFIVYGQKL